MAQPPDDSLQRTLGFDVLMAYTAWERQEWYEWLQQRGDQVLQISAGPHGDGRFETVGELIRHVFSGETRYVERLSDQSPTDTTAIPTDSIEALFQFAQQSRKGLTELVEAFPAEEWDVPKEYETMDYRLTATPRKIVTHILLHEIRHWAQIATLFRLNGLVGGFHDLLVSPVLGGEFALEEDDA